VLVVSDQNIQETSDNTKLKDKLLLPSSEGFYIHGTAGQGTAWRGKARQGVWQNYKLPLFITKVKGGKNEK